MLVSIARTTPAKCGMVWAFFDQTLTFIYMVIIMIFKWELGRGMSGYDKLLLCCSSRLKFDCWILRFKEGSYIDPHVDAVKSGKHYRLNIILRKAEEGGEFICFKVIWKFWRVVLFRPDIAVHRVKPIIKGTRYVLSIGWVIS